VSGDEKLTRAQLAELRRIGEAPHGVIYDPGYVYPHRHVRRLEALGLVRSSGGHFFSRWVGITDAGRERLASVEN
jgi:hypothetical protein